MGQHPVGSERDHAEGIPSQRPTGTRRVGRSGPGRAQSPRRDRRGVATPQRDPARAADQAVAHGSHEQRRLRQRPAAAVFIPLGVGEERRYAGTFYSVLCVQQQQQRCNGLPSSIPTVGDQRSSHQQPHQLYSVQFSRKLNRGTSFPSYLLHFSASYFLLGPVNMADVMTRNQIVPNKKNAHSDRSIETRPISCLNILR